MPRRRSIHSAKWHRCIRSVSQRGKRRGKKRLLSPHAICTDSLGRAGTFKPSYRKRNRKAQSTIQPVDPGRYAWYREARNVQSKDGVKVGRMYWVGSQLVGVRSIYQRGNDPWQARVTLQDGADTGMPLQDIVKALRAKGRHPIADCYAVGSRPVRRRKVNPAPTKFYLFVRWGRGWLRYDGKHFSTREPAVFRSPAEAWKMADKLRADNPKKLGKRELYVTSHTWPIKI